MKKLVFITPLLFALSAFGQNLVQTNNANINLQQQRFVQVNQVFASNMAGNINNTNKTVRANANPQVNIQRASSGNVNQRQQNRRRAATNRVNTNISNPVQTNVINVLENNVNSDIQPLVNFSQQADINDGNSFGNENLIEQIASVNIPAIQVGSGSLNLNLDINLPRIKLPSIKLSSHKSVTGSKHKTFHIKNKLAKLNRNMGKYSFAKKLKIKVDNCFEW